MAFKKGDKVVCIEEFTSTRAFLWKTIGVKFPSVGRTYTIRLVHDCGGLLLEEIINNKYDTVNGFEEPNFSPIRFAPIQYRSVGISKELAKSFTETLETSEVITKKLKENA